jgi:glycosyltransferase involved in cell wall biosynthesis
MNFLIVTHAEHKRNAAQQIGGYAPYVREMNIWAKHVDHITIVAPLLKEPFSPIDIVYEHPSITFVEIPEISYTSIKNILHACVQLPVIFGRIFTQMRKADHIHLRCPGSIGLIGCIVQMLFPWKKKTAKYAGNWDWKSSQPFSYRIQQLILRSTLLTYNIKVLVYGKWRDANRNILPFFTATYSEKDKEPEEQKSVSFSKPVNLIFVGAFTKGKQPLLAVKVAEAFAKAGVSVELNMFGEGAEMQEVKDYVSSARLENIVKIHGNQPEKLVREYYKKSHFLVFISKSEGWPKVVAESMFWGCVPITTRVSCVPEMLGEDERGALVEPNVDFILKAIVHYVQHSSFYESASTKGMTWSRQFTLERFETEIAKLV